MIEAVPNVSEGRREEVISALTSTLCSVSGLFVLDVSSDAAHHRSVFTFAGDTEAVATASLALIERAVALIDLRMHRGVHPRLGAVDVLPFVPLADVTLDACVALARRVGAEVAARWQLPVYLYEAAATSAARRRLEDIRRGEFEGLAARMRDPDWAPDFGPRHPHPTAGALIVGARLPLIAFNVNLESRDLDVARAIARVVRERSGGLPAVKALGVPLVDRDVVQVSMNLTDYTRTSPRRAFEAVRREAARRGVVVRESEFVGLVPRASLADTTPEALQLKDFSEDQILEERLARTPPNG